MPKIVTVVGARPQFIKAATVSRIVQQTDGLNELLVHTGQHHDVAMSDVFFDELGIPAPAFNLGVSGGGHGAMTGAMLQRLEPLLLEQKPDGVLVYGDTNSTLAGALAASKLHISVAHVEAGLRSFNRRMPEELNRILTDQLADRLFSSTDAATANLRHEGVPDELIHQVGDVMYDAALIFGDKARSDSSVLSRAGVRPGEYALATVHRAENTDDDQRLTAIMTALDTVARDFPVVLPLHPRTRGAMQRLGLQLQHVTVIDPVGYLDMVALECQAVVIATDSGGVQKEAYFHGVPCVTLRDETEWVELVAAGWNQLVPPLDMATIVHAVLSARGRKGADVRPYGDGDAARKVVSTLVGDGL